MAACRYEISLLVLKISTLKEKFHISAWMSCYIIRKRENAKYPSVVHNRFSYYT